MGSRAGIGRTAVVGAEGRVLGRTLFNLPRTTFYHINLDRKIENPLYRGNQTFFFPALMSKILPSQAIGVLNVKTG